MSTQQDSRDALERVGRVRRELQRVARSGSWDEKRTFLLIPVDDELSLLEHMLGEESGPDLFDRGTLEDLLEPGPPQAQLAKRRLTELGDNFSDSCIVSALGLLTPGERGRLRRLLERAEGRVRG